jgi:ADP-ribose pyrophosphatase YjhB (NUDIX family)
MLYYTGLSGIIEKEDTFLILKRASDCKIAPNVWEVITGLLEGTENPDQGVLRIIEEKTSLSAEVVIPTHTDFLYYGSRDHPMVGIGFWCRALEGEVQLSPEHTESRWITLEEALNHPHLLPFYGSFKCIARLKRYLPHDF